MQKIKVRAFSYNKIEQTLSEEASSLTGRLDLAPILNQMEYFLVEGDRETKQYAWSATIREEATNEVGDILHWEFRPINGHGRYQPGPKIIIYND